jgi:hypothetical protein
MQARAIVALRWIVKRGLKVRSLNANAFLMNEETGKNMSREERLAAKLRENLRRRKAQGRELKAESRDNGLPKNDPDS